MTFSMKKPKTPYELFGRSCHAGWSDLIQPLEDELLRLGGTIVQIKEKFGGLCFYYRLPRRISKDAKAAFARRVRQACDASFTICETCDKPGELGSDGGYLFTACAACGEARSALNRD
jgi:hypothetical protein